MDTIDTTTYRFRTAVGGFHKGDVADYIANISQIYRDEIKYKDRKLEELRQENAALRQQLESFTAAADLPEEPIEEAAPTVSALELEAYRRAEAMERLTNQRAKKLYGEMESICRGTESEFEAAKAAVEQTAQAVMSQAQVLDEACKKLTEALHSSRQELSALDAMLPDPAETLGV